MAARHLQKLRTQDLPSSETVDADASDSEEENTAPPNPFGLLDDQEVGCAAHCGCYNRVLFHANWLLFEGRGKRD